MPPQMIPPTMSTIVPNGQLSTININWVTPTKTGGSPITGYYVQLNSGYNTPFLQPGTLIAAGTNLYTFTNLVAGAFYLFRIAAVNTIYTANQFPGDALNFSNATSQIIALVPGQVTTLAQQSFNY